MAITRAEIEENELIDTSILDEIPKQCECGAEILFTDTTRQIYCSNPRCTYKVASRLEKMAKEMGVDGFGEANCIKLCKFYRMISPFQIFNLKDRNDLDICGVSAARKIVDNICESERRSVRLYEVVKYCGIPDIDGNATKIFSGYSSMENAYRDIESGQVAFISEKLGIKKIDSAVLAVRIYNNLIEYKSELFFGEMVLNIIQEEGKQLKIAIHGGVYGYKNKGQFINYLNTRYKGKLNVILVTSVSSDVDILISENGIDNSGKVRNASKINAKNIENGIKQGQFTLEDVGKMRNPNDLYKIGEKVIICNQAEAIKRIDNWINEEIV